MDRIQHVRERWKARVYTFLLIHFQRKSSNSFDENRDKWLTVLISRPLSPIERAVSGTVRLQHAGKSPSLRLMTHFPIPWSFRWQDYIFTWVIAHCHWPRWGAHFQAALQLRGPVTRAQVFSDVIPVQEQKLLASSNFTQKSLLGASMNLNFVVSPSWYFRGSHSQSHLHTSLSDPSFRSPVPT